MTTILLVENDPLLALARKSMLERRFRNVVRVRDAAEALCLIEQCSFTSNLGLIISGHHGSGLGGPAFVAELCERVPGIPVLVIADANESPRDYAQPGVSVLSRPISTEQIVATAGEMLLPEIRAAA